MRQRKQPVLVVAPSVCLEVLISHDATSASVGFDRSSVLEQWPFMSTDLTLFSKRLLWNAMPSFVCCRCPTADGQLQPVVKGRF